MMAHDKELIETVATAWRQKDRETTMRELMPLSCYMTHAGYALDAHAAHLESKGLVVVPREPTKAMYFAGTEANRTTMLNDGDGGGTVACYRAMIQVAQKGVK